MRNTIKQILKEYYILEMAKNMGQGEFIRRAKEIHGDEYDYSKVNYVNNRTKVNIICNKHEIEFPQTPGSHLSGQGCPKCRYEKSSLKTRLPKGEFIKRANEVHNGEYGYDKVDYKSMGEKVVVTCKEHGDFPVTPANHLGGSGCPDCYGTKKRTTQQFIDDAKKVHGNEYDYSETEYFGTDKPLKIKCEKHGYFYPIAYNHLKGDKCPKCAGNQKSNTIEFIEKAKKIHGDRYNYEKVDYSTNKTPIVITCLKPNHGDFLLRPNSHLNGTGCPVCSESRGEKYLSTLLDDLNIKYTRQFKFKDCTNLKTGRYCRRLPFDFYLPDYNSVIEYDGIQHFNSVDFWGGENSLKTQQLRDQLKNQYCEKNGIKMIRIPYTMNKEEIRPYILKELNTK